MKIKCYKNIKYHFSAVKFYSELFRDLGFKVQNILKKDSSMITLLPKTKNNKWFFRLNIFKDKYASEQVGYIETNIINIILSNSQCLHQIKKEAKKMIKFHSKKEAK